MNHFELRWNLTNVLQFRYQYDARVYAGLQPWPNSLPPVLKWSNWMDVQHEQEPK